MRPQNVLDRLEGQHEGQQTWFSTSAFVQTAILCSEVQLIFTFTELLKTFKYSTVTHEPINFRAITRSETVATPVVQSFYAENMVNREQIHKKEISTVLDSEFIA